MIRRRGRFRRSCARSAARTWGFIAALPILALLTSAGCGDEHPVKSPETLAAEAEAGAFDDYYARILLLAQTHSAEPDSFRAAVAALPGSRLDEESWEAWVRPWVDDPRRFTDRLESMLADMKPRPSPARGADSTRVPGAPPPP